MYIKKYLLVPVYQKLLWSFSLKKINLIVRCEIPWITVEEEWGIVRIWIINGKLIYWRHSDFRGPCIYKRGKKQNGNLSKSEGIVLKDARNCRQLCCGLWGKARQKEWRGEESKQASLSFFLFPLIWMCQYTVIMMELAAADGKWKKNSWTGLHKWNDGFMNLSKQHLI